MEQTVRINRINTKDSLQNDDIIYVTRGRRKMNSKEFQQGIEARHNGLEVADNPYDYDSELDSFIEWDLGWGAANEQIRIAQEQLIDDWEV